MKTEFRNFAHDDYQSVCQFLIKLNDESRQNINWNWARWEWMFFHPELDIESLDTIGLWFDDDEVVGLATYDHYNGEAFFATLTAYKSLEEQLLEYVIANFQDKTGLGIAVNDANEAGIALLEKYNFEIAQQSEQVLACDLENADLHYELHPDFQLHNLQPENDLYEHHEVLWEGFENEGPLPLDEKTLNVQKRMLTAPHLDSSLHIVAKNQAGFAAYCGGWYDKTTDYAYIEPLCTKPAYRKLGLGKALVLETLHRCGLMGAKKAYVISDDSFYKNIGFEEHSHFSFYWYKPQV